METEEINQLVREGEELGFDYYWMPDQTFFKDPFVILTRLVDITSYIKLGIAVTNPYTRHPVQVARAIGTLNHISRGRVSLGLGAGNRKQLLEPLGMRQSKPAIACQEATQIIRKLVTGETVTFQGEFFSVTGVRLEFPVESAPPVLMAGRGPMTLQKAGEVADGVIIGGLVAKVGLQYAFRNIRNGLSTSTQPNKDFYKVSWVTAQLTEDPEQAMKEAKPIIGHIIGGAPSQVLNALKIDQGRQERLKAAYAQGGPQAAADYVTDTEVDMFSIIGHAEKFIKKIKLLSEFGIDQISLLLGPRSLTDTLKFLESFSDQVMAKINWTQL
ncbi:MAG: LLM class flavin-dependent oxidoreductase [Candidatus Bipolaricaulia bacterium]